MVGCTARWGWLAGCGCVLDQDGVQTLHNRLVRMSPQPRRHRCQGQVQVQGVRVHAALDAARLALALARRCGTTQATALARAWPQREHFCDGDRTGGALPTERSGEPFRVGILREISPAHLHVLRAHKGRTCR